MLKTYENIYNEYMIKLSIKKSYSELTINDMIYVQNEVAKRTKS